MGFWIPPRWGEARATTGEKRECSCNKCPVEEIEESSGGVDSALIQGGGRGGEAESGVAA